MRVTYTAIQPSSKYPTDLAVYQGEAFLAHFHSPDASDCYVRPTVDGESWETALVTDAGYTAAEFSECPVAEPTRAEAVYAFHYYHNCQIRHTTKEV